ncbi:MAG: hypothetical protein LBU51_04455 [Bacteroidales bacterium]|jgi:Flp pilus assembly protein TadD/outer membrane protein OmpA-like peptidoglycan-associated protein|nr:hypothetical protein [Bacteroidales bacterium]
MKQIKLLSVVCILALFVAGCGIKKMVKKYPEVGIQLENTDLENKGGNVAYTVKGTVPPKYLKKKAAVEIEVPYLIYDTETGESKVVGKDKITLAGEKSKVAGTVIPYKTGGTFSKSGSFKYEEEYANANVAAVSVISKGKKNQKMEPRLLGEGVSNTPSLISLFPEIQNADDNGKITGNGTFLINGSSQYREEFINRSATIYFEVNTSNLNWNLKLNKDQAAKDQIKALVDFINTGKAIDKVTLYGWASPEGEESNNQGLSEKRFEQGKKWFNEQFDKYLKDYAKANKIKIKDLVRPELVFENNAKGEDWSGFEMAVEKSNIAEKNQILNVVRSQSNNSLKEQKIREMTDIYNEIKEAILPPLRRAEVILRVNAHNYNDAQIAEYAISQPELLSLNEKLYAVTLTDDAAKKETIYNTIIADDNNQKDWRAYNNLAILQINNCFKTKDITLLQKAQSNLDKANAVSPSNGIILNNLGVLSYLKGDVNSAKTNFEASQKASNYPIDQNYNLGMYEILNGNYDKAKTLMANKHCDYNMALTQVVNKEYDAAKETLNCIKDQTAEVSYLKAVLAARTNNANDVYSNLRAAIAANGDYVKKAAKDPEFKKLRKQAEFIQIVK